MDEFKKEFNPIDEYESIDEAGFQSNVPDNSADKEPEIKPDNSNVADNTTQNVPQQAVKQAEPHQTRNNPSQHAQQPHNPSPSYPPHGVNQHYPPQYQPYGAQRTQPPVYPPHGAQQPNYHVYPPYGVQQPNYTVYPPHGAPQPPYPPHGAPQPPYPPHGAPQPPYPPQGYPATSVYNPYTPANNIPPNYTPNKPRPGFKVFIGILIGLFVLYLISFTISITYTVSEEHPLSKKVTESETLVSKEYKGSYYDVDIELEKDNGQVYNEYKSHKNVYSGDSSVELKAKSEPKDKDDNKYNAEKVYKDVKDSVVSITCYENRITDNPDDAIGSGTGTIISEDGYIVTNSHVIHDNYTYKVKVKLANSKEYPAQVVGLDSRTDIAVIKINANNLKPAILGDSSQLNIGQDIIAIGNPGGEEYQNSLTKGVVSGLDVNLSLSQNVKYIQLDAAINPGNSGGPLCNIYGQVIGINTAKISDVVYEGMGFAIPSNIVIDIANDLIEYGYVKGRLRIGISCYTIDNEIASAYSIPYGVVIESIEEDGPMGDSDVMEYDIITEINGVPIESVQDIYGELEKYEAGDTVTITVYRINT